LSELSFSLPKGGTPAIGIPPLAFGGPHARKGKRCAVLTSQVEISGWLMGGDGENFNCN
jgi:hypothetical protein